MTRIKLLDLFFGVVFLTVAMSPVTFADDAPKRVCDYADVTIRSDFSAGRVSDCAALDDGTVRLTIRPEDEPPINPSPWYSFRVEPKKAAKITLELVYEHAKHRYWPKVSRDGKTWFYLADEAVRKLNDRVVRLSLGIQDAPLYVSAQEILTHDEHRRWVEKVAATSGVQFSVIGQSKGGLPLMKLESRAGDASGDYVVLIGRQHPPEVTGALALMAFGETVLGDTDLARRFRNKFGVVIVPELNPDGVEGGHWRHSLGDMDLNRDWFRFTQPETLAMRRELDRFVDQDRLWLFADFHSTTRNVFYVQADAEQTIPAGLTREWLEGAREAGGVYEFEYAERPMSDKPTSKNYVFQAFGVPAITYEVGDETDRNAIRDSAAVFAEQMMRTLLKRKANGD